MNQREVRRLLHERYRRYHPTYVGDGQWWLDHPSGGTMSVHVRCGRSYGSISVDRIRTTDRPKDAADEWFKREVWPSVTPTRHRRMASLPSGNPTFSWASCLPVADLRRILPAWLDCELADWKEEQP